MELKMLPSPLRQLFGDIAPTELEVLLEINDRLKTIEYLLRLHNWRNIPSMEEYLQTLRKRKGG